MPIIWNIKYVKTIQKPRMASYCLVILYIQTKHLVELWLAMLGTGIPGQQRLRAAVNLAATRITLYVLVDGNWQSMPQLPPNLIITWFVLYIIFKNPTRMKGLDYFLCPLFALATTIKGRLAVELTTGTTGLRQRKVVTSRTACTSVPDVLALRRATTSTAAFRFAVLLTSLSLRCGGERKITTPARVNGEKPTMEWGLSKGIFYGIV